MRTKKILTAICVSGLLFSAAAAVNKNLLPVHTVQAASKKSKYVKAKITLPAGYTRSALLKAYQGKPSASFIKASMKGHADKQF